MMSEMNSVRINQWFIRGIGIITAGLFASKGDNPVRRDRRLDDGFSDLCYHLRRGHAVFFSKA